MATVNLSCGEILSKLNEHLYPRIEKQTFMALGLAIINHTDGVLQWANSGQPHPIVKQGEQVSGFESDGELPLGMMPDVEYPNWELKLQTDDTIIFYTDGVIEAENEEEEIYGIERLEQIIARMYSAANSEEVIEIILRDISDFIGSAEQYDDITVVVVKKL